MFEFEDMSTGFHDGFLSKYADSSGPILDLYISDSMQDMLDIDIRTEVATVVGGTNEFASLVNDLPSLDDIESASNDGEASWLGGPKWSAPSDFYADVGACVNPNSVMPIISSSLLNSPKVNLNTNNRSSTSPPLSPKENKSHLTFSPNQIKIPMCLQDTKRTSSLLTSTNVNNKQSAEVVKKDLASELKGLEEKISKTSVLHSNGLLPRTNTIKLAPGIGGLTFANSIAYNKLKQHSPANKTLSNINPNGNIKKERESSPLRNVNGNIHNGNITTSGNSNNLSRKILMQSRNSVPSKVNGTSSPPVGSPQRHIICSIVNKNNSSNNKSKQPIGPEFPKPAYSYSCLIAMALKNSRSGSLPVSEIYSFMCEHFPYFKTAPNGWKNSVRHNLSLNKCFEKIEKPATNGGQRKGCLWAMNPSKIIKMDEEVQKWSRKDPMAIRKAMVFPEHLEALERGEMKHGSLGDSDGEIDSQSDIEENSDLEQELDENLIETPESFVEEDDDEQQEKDFDIEVQDIYDAIDVEDEKESLHMAIRQHEIIEYTENNFQPAKRARLDVNYSIGPAGILQQQIQQNHIKQQQHHQHQQQQQQQQQQPQPAPHHNRRKMQLVNRIA